MKTMDKVNVLIVGGYGLVGREAAKLLSTNLKVNLFIGGRDIEKAIKTARELNVNSIYIDANDIQSIKDSIKDMDIIINCFIDITKVNVEIAKAAIKFGKKYLDIAGVPVEHLYSIIELDKVAKDNNALLITGLGVNPGIAGLLIKKHAQYFDEVLISDIYFTLGSDFEDISVLSLRGVGQMINIPPKIWDNNNWIKPKQSSLKYQIGLPFNKQIYFSPAMITPDILILPKLYNIKELRFWSGIESLMQSLVFILGIKLGYTKTDKKAEKFLRFLKSIGRNKRFHSELNLTIVSKGLHKGKAKMITNSFYCTEVLATAIAPVIVCEQIIERKYDQSGAFFPIEIVDPIAFVDRLAKSGIHYKEELIDI